MELTFHRRISALIVIACLALSAMGPTLAFAAPTPKQRIEATREKAEKAAQRLDELADDLEERNEEYLEIEDELDQTRRRISDTERELDQAIRDLDAAELRLNDRASAIYRGGSLNILDVLVGVTDFQDLVARLDLMRRVSFSDAVVVRDVKSARERITEAKTALETRRAEQTVLRDRAAAKRSEVKSALSAQKRYLAEINSDLKKLIKEERERQERLARERAAEAARIAAQKAAQSGRDFDPGALGEPHKGAVTVARTFVGKTPYVWGGTSPSGFDCSGLVQYCYRQVGISIPRTSRQQFRFGSFIPANRLDLLEPGDLVFFGRGGDPGRVHHVGMYIGGGDMIHAPQTGMLVSVSSLHGRIAARGDYVGATRP